MTATAASTSDVEQVTHPVRPDDEVVYADASCMGAGKRPEIADDEHPSTVQWWVAARKGKPAA